MNDRWLHVPSAVVAVLATSVVLNVGQFAGIDLSMTEWYDAVSIKPGHDLEVLAAEHFESTQERFLLLTTIRDLAPGAVMVLPPSVDWTQEGLRGLGAVAGVERVDEQAGVDAATAALLEEMAVLVGEDRQIGPYALVLDAEAPAQRLVAVEGPQRLYVVDQEIAAGLGIEVAP